MNQCVATRVLHECKCRMALMARSWSIKSLSAILITAQRQQGSGCTVCNGSGRRVGRCRPRCAVTPERVTTAGHAASRYARVAAIQSQSRYGAARPGRLPLDGTSDDSVGGKGDGEAG